MSKRNLLILVSALLLISITLIILANEGTTPVFSTISIPSLIINEVMPSNRSVLLDQDGDSSDWIELYNTANTPVRLAGYGLSDDASKPGKWVFPDVTIPAKGYLVVFASGKNKMNGKEVHASFRIRSEGEELVLTDPQGEAIDAAEIPACENNRSFGRPAENPVQWAFLDLPSPGFPNSEQGAADFEASRWVSGPLRINEVMADNVSVLQDEDGDYSDWVEITNTGSSAVNLAGYGLSRDRDDLFQWSFPELSLQPGQNLVVFCSGKNRKNSSSELHAGFRINKSSEQLFLANPMGQIADSAEIRNLPPDASLARMASDEWEASDRPSPGYENTAEGYAEYVKACRPPSPLILSEVMSRNENTLSDEDGNFYDWIEIKNAGNEPLNLGNYWLSDDSGKIHKWRFPDMTLQPGSYAVVFLSPDYTTPKGESYLHADFALSASGDVVYLSDTSGKVLQKLTVPELTDGVTYGVLDGEANYFYFTVPTPGRANDPASRCDSYAEKPVFSSGGGFYPGPCTLTIKTPQDGAVVHYTTDGSVPTLSSPVASGPLTIEKTTVVRAAAFKKGFLTSPVVTNTYLLETGNNLVTVCISTNPENLWSEETGIYAMGHPYEDVYPFHGANFWQEWEKPAYIEYYQEDGSLVFGMDAGISIHGEYTQALDHKSFGIDARKKYGSEFIHYAVFPEKPYSHYQSIVLRNSGQDNGNTKLRDVLISQLMKETGLDYQAYRPAVLYLNGEYWGFYTLRESTDKHFLKANHPEINMENLDIIEGNWRVHQGDRLAYQELLNYIKSHDLSDAANYDYVKSKMDVDNFIDYQIAVIYGANVDNGNIKFWRERTEGSKWQWILFDFDMAFRYPEHDTVADVFNPAGTGSEDMFSTVIQVGLLQNQDFRDQFLRRFAYHMKSTFEPQRVIALIDQLATEIEPEMERNYTKWKGSMSTWRSCITKMKDFFVQRPDNAKKFIQQFFHLTDSQMKEYGF
jgi:hypothetical protein